MSILDQRTQSFVDECESTSTIEPTTKETMLEQPARTVKPRMRQYIARPVVAVLPHDDICLSEHYEFGRVSDLIDSLPTMQPTLFAVVNGADFLATLDKLFSADDTTGKWQWRVSTNERDICRPDGIRVATRVSTVVHYFGWKNGNYHKLIDPVVMYGRKLEEIWPGDDSRIRRLLAWATCLRDFCDTEHTDVRPTIGGIGSQFLTDHRFYPGARRKIPKATNETIREYLPGNHYNLNVFPQPNREYTALYLDQHRAHHYHARTVPLPAANTLYAHGRFTDLAEIVFPNTWDNFYGLYCLDLERVPGKHARAFSWVGRHLDRLFVYSNELAHLGDMGYRVRGVRAAWGSRHRDMGIAKYAAWAEQKLDEHGDPAWLKPLLLSTYGVLATKPRESEAVFRLASSGEPVTLHTGKNKLNGLLTKSAKKLEPKIANVLQRAMIEAATRSDSVGLAQQLNNLGYQVLSIYADAVIVRQDDDQPAPLLAEPWRLKTILTHLQFINQQAFMSGEMTKLPGIGRELRDYRQHSPGQAPKRKMIEAVTGYPVKSNRRI